MRERWDTSRLPRVITLSAAACGGIAGTVLKRLDLLGQAERVRVLALVFLVIAVALLFSSTVHRLLGYATQEQRQGNRSRRRVATQLVTAVRHEQALSVYFFAAWAIERAWPIESLEWLLAVFGYIAFLRVCGRVHRLAVRLGLPSISASVLASRMAAETREDLWAWTREPRPNAAPPGVDRLDNWLRLLPRVGKTSAGMGLLATLLASVAVASTGSALESAGTGVLTLIGGASADSKPRASVWRTKSGTGGRRAKATSATLHRTRTVVEQAPPTPTYEALCGLDREPGRGAPEPAGSQLYQLWLGPEGVGGRIGGCVARANSVREAVWYAVGYRDSEVVSIGVVNANGTSALLLGQAARFAATQARAGALEWVSTRVLAGYRDLEIVEANGVRRVFIRM